MKLQICAPDAASVRVVGDWNPKSPMGDPLTKDAQGVWSISVGQLEPDLYTYSFFVDGVKTIDPNNVHSTNDALRIGSYFIVAGPGTMSEFYENKGVRHGEVTAVWYASKSWPLRDGPWYTRRRLTAAARSGTPCCICSTDGAAMKMSGRNQAVQPRSWTICSPLTRLSR